MKPRINSQNIESFEEIIKTIEKIAKDELLIETLKQRMRDSLDFHDVSVWGVKKALIKAFLAGMKYKNKKEIKNGKRI